MKLDQALVDAAVAQLERRWPGEDAGVAAAMYLDDGTILTSVSLDNLNAAAGLCAETGAICQAYTIGANVTASVCVARTPGRIMVLAPCGICQERLALWGPDVQVGVSKEGNEGWLSKTLIEVNPYYWGAVFTDGGVWPSGAVHRG